MRLGHVVPVGLCAMVWSVGVSGSFPVVSDAATSGRATPLSWRDCGEGFECATARVPLDYRRRGGREIGLVVTRLPAQDRAQRIGSLFLNPGGPGGSGIQFLRDEAKLGLAALNDRFDLVSWDPRGVGASAGALDCAVDHGRGGPFGPPFARPGRRLERSLRRRVVRYVRRCMARARRPGVLSHIHTANTARDLDRLRAAVGDRKLSYLGYSYGTHIGATYATLFPRRVRVLALDGAVDVEGQVDDPIRARRRQTQAFELALGRFLAACARQADRCGFIARSPRVGYDELLERLDRRSIPTPTAANPHPIDGDDLRTASLGTLTRKQLWPVLRAALMQAQAGDGSLIRTVLDVGAEIEAQLSTDWFVAIEAVDARWPGRPALYIRNGRSAYQRFEHFGGTLYGDLAFGLWPVKPLGAYYGPVENSRRATTALVVGTTHDPSTPYVWAKRLTADLGNARLLTMRGDGHAASFGGNSVCIDAAVEAYLERRMLPEHGSACPQQVPFVTSTSASAQQTLEHLYRRALAAP